MTEQTTQTVVDQGGSGTSNVAPTSTATPAAPAHIQTQQQLQQQQQNQAFMQQFWNRQISIAEQFESDFKNHPLPLARIKKVMKSDQDVKMISAEAPILFSKACEIFISEITMRAWIHAEENKRRTLQRSDVASAVSRSDQFDFLIDIVPREEVPKSSNRRPKEEPQAEHMYTEQQQQNVLAYYPGMPYAPPDATSYYQQLHTEHIQHEIQLQEQLRIQHQQFAERERERQQSSTSSGTTSQTVVTQQQQQQEQTQTSQQQRSTQSTTQDQKQISQQIKTSAPTSATPSDGSVIDDQQIQAAVNMLTSVHTKQEPEDQDKQRSKSTRKGSKKTKK